MGLGKTAQVLALLHIVKDEFNKVVIVTPAGLISNWRQENDRWLENHELPLLVCEAGSNQNTLVSKFLSAQRHQVLLISYQLFVRHFDRLNAVIELIVFDEGHKLKSKNAKLMHKLNSLECKRRILLTGTPLQNSLEEFYNCAYFVCPEIMMERREFMAKYERSIMHCLGLSTSRREELHGHERLRHLKKLSSKFMMRRTSHHLENLPARREYLLFVPLSPIQYSIYKAMTDAYIDERQRAELEIGQSMKLITMLQKLTNHPDILLRKLPLDSPFREPYGQPRHADLLRPLKVGDSTKFKVMTIIVKEAMSKGDNTVICSNFTSTLDTVSNYLRAKQIGFLRIDGNTLPADRHKIIERFKVSLGEFPVFLLSSKAGGVGINLVGGNRMILMEPDWNPSNDLQVMGRVWRDGQLKPVFIYRLFSSGTLDEKIHQLQRQKTNLSDCMLDKRSVLSQLTPNELYDIFRLYVGCQSYSKVEINMEHDDYQNSLLDTLIEFLDAIVLAEDKTSPKDL